MKAIKEEEEYVVGRYIMVYCPRSYTATRSKYIILGKVISEGVYEAIKIYKLDTDYKLRTPSEGVGLVYGFSSTIEFHYLLDHEETLNTVLMETI